MFSLRKKVLSILKNRKISIHIPFSKFTIESSDVKSHLNEIQKIFVKKAFWEQNCLFYWTFLWDYLFKCKVSVFAKSGYE